MQNASWSRLIGGILLVTGTTIGAAMLAIPVATGFMGFYPALLLFVVCWFFMLLTAFFFLDVNFFIPGNINIITMVERTLGNAAKTVAWIVYLLLLYSLVAAYIGAGGLFFKTALESLFHITITPLESLFFMPLIFGGFIYLGTKWVDYLNRPLMLGLFICYVVLVFAVPSHIDGNLLKHVDFGPAIFALPIVLTSFGYHIIIPSLTTYLHHDKKALKKVLLIGSIVPLVIYGFWELVVLGCVPLQGAHGLVQAWKQGTSSIEPLSIALHAPWLGFAAQFFSFFAIVTSFLGVTLSLSDFLIDGVKIKKGWEGRIMACVLTFAPPLLFLFISQRGFVIALEYAGVFVAILLGILPALMVNFIKTPNFYHTWKGKVMIGAVLIFFIGIVVVTILDKTGCLNFLLAPYLTHA